VAWNTGLAFYECDVTFSVVFGWWCPTADDFGDGVFATHKVGVQDYECCTIAVGHAGKGFETFVCAFDFALECVRIVADV
jgi:hypothetical protein